MLDTLGKRLKCCRAATSTTPQEVVAYINQNGGELSYPSYTRWESGHNIPKRKAYLLRYIADFFKVKGFTVSSEWIESGEGFPPQFSEYSNLDEDTLFILTARSLSNSELIQIGGSYGEPFVNLGEMCIISKESEIINNNGKLCWIKVNKDPHPMIGIVKIASEDTVLVKMKKE
ncbi:hypothetical protein [Serratia symbiotica]|uniref:Uncharacterized protein n=1 Tax=Serratia symbiotica TaxID=138074 RepID=A0A068Z1Z1_9GAMM|nr:hypothetical protein [Serratia symbiotica]QLH62895.1 hypothetical protein SYMBAF_08080 [Serratia symbiotica]CDS57517.1 conserved hypothetical protein [Serratia symbiotica]